MNRQFLYETGQGILKIMPGTFCTFDTETPGNGMHSHSSYECTFVLSGKGVFQYGEQKLPVSEKNIFLAPPGVRHEIRIEAVGHPRRKLRFYYLSFQLEYPSERVPRLEEEKMIAAFLKGYRTFLEQDQGIFRQLSFLWDYAKRFGSDNQAVRQGYLGLVLDLMGKLSFQKKTAVKEYHRNHLADDAVGYIACHFKEPVTMKELAGHCQTSVRNLQQVFRSSMGCTVTEYLARIRLNHACSYLKLDEKVSVAGEKSGIPDPSHFSRLFKRYYGISPLEYQKKERKMSAYLLQQPKTADQGTVSLLDGQK